MDTEEAYLALVHRLAVPAGGQLRGMASGRDPSRTYISLGPIRLVGAAILIDIRIDRLGQGGHLTPDALAVIVTRGLGLLSTN